MNSILMALAFLLFAGADDPIPSEPFFLISVNNTELQTHMMAFTASPGKKLLFHIQIHLTGLLQL